MIKNAMQYSRIQTIVTLENDHGFRVNESLLWRHNGCLKSPASRLFTQLFIQGQIKENTGLCARNSSVTGEFPLQMASNAENVSI